MSINKNQKELYSSKICKKCGKEFSFSDVANMYDNFQYDTLKKLWTNVDIDFYCSCCYFLKLIKILKSRLNKKD
ncbi:MAG: hypothetical protein ACP6IY_09915 [Promethearchaeia archaeon]